MRLWSFQTPNTPAIWRRVAFASGAMAIAALLAVPSRAQPSAGDDPELRPDAPVHSHLELHAAQDPTDLPEGVGPRHERWEKAAYLGVATWPAQPALRRQIGLPRGVGLVVEFIDRKSPADGGLHQYDVIHKLDDQLLVNPQQLAVLVRCHQPGDTIKLAVIRDGKALTVDVKLTEKEVPPLDELRLGAAEPAGADNVPPPGEHDWPAGADLPGRHIGGTGFSMPRSDGDYRVFWNDGSADLSISNQGTHRLLVFRDRSGQVLFRGPIDTVDQRDMIPKEVRDQLRSLPAPFKLPSDPATRPSTRAADGEKADAAEKITAKEENITQKGLH